MYTQCISLLFFLGSLYAVKASWRTSSITCPIPEINHGRVIVRGYRGKMIRFVCDKRYELAGNKYATCRDHNWDVPIPVCIRGGCPLPNIENGVQIPTSNGAYVTHFCFPGYTMIGSPVIYCDGREWNATAPICVDSTQKIASSCDFEDPGLCGWTQDEMHDFDWTRLNNKTPSSFLLTGPSYDHTYGKNGSGYYMYIESTSRLRNDTARFISPIYNKVLSENGCFSFFFHMFGNTCGGLRVYQKPDNVPLQNILKLSDSSKNQYILFEQWGNHGDIWINSVSSLTNFDDNFQIIIEGIRGSSFTSDIAIDDVSILQGENCTAAMDKITTPSVLFTPDSCTGRCQSTAPPSYCGCSSACLTNNDCCLDFLELCVFMIDSGDDDIASSNGSYEIPQTDKLISSTTPTPTSTTTITTISTTSTSRPTTTTSTTTIDIDNTYRTTSRPKTTPKPVTTPTPTTTPRPTNTLRPGRGRRPNPTITTRPTITPRPTITSTVTTTLTYPTYKPTSTRITTGRPESPVTVRTTESKIKSTTQVTTASSTKRTITPWNTKTLTITNTSSTKRPSTTTIKVSTTDMSHGISRTIENHNQYHEIVEKAKKEQAIEVRKLHHQSNEQKKSSGWKLVFIILGTVICLASVSWFLVVSRSFRGRQILARLRGRCNQDPEVRYLSTDVDD